MRPSICAILGLPLIFLLSFNINCSATDNRPASITSHSLRSITKHQDQLWTVGEKGVVFFSDADGNNWTKMDLTIDKWLNDIGFSNGGNGWIAGMAGTLLYSPDHGKHWRQRHLSFNQNFHCLWIEGESEIWIGGSHGLIICSTDTGFTWSVRRLGRDGVIRGLFFSDSIGWAVGDHGMIIKTIDHGSSWETIPGNKIHRVANFHGITFTDPLHGIVWGDAGTIIITEDGGNNWKKLSAQIPASVRHIEIISDRYLLLMGEEAMIGLLDLAEPDPGWRDFSDMIFNASHMVETDRNKDLSKSTSPDNRLNITGKSSPAPVTIYDSVLLPNKHQVLAVGSRGFICRINCDSESDEKSQSCTINSTDILHMDTVKHSRPDLFDRQFKTFNGSTYKLNPLGEGYSGKIDQDPRFNTGQFDCQTAIEHALALAIADPPPDQVLPVLDQIRYEAGQVSFWTRNHFFVPDWIPYNSWIIEDITSSLADTLAIKLTRVIGRQKFLSYYDIKNPHLKDEKISTYVIPLEHIHRLKDKIKTGMIVAFIGKSKKDNWLFTIHTGSLFWQEENLFLRHASSTAKKVVEEDFFDYLNRGKDRILGIKLLKIVD